MKTLIFSSLMVFTALAANAANDCDNSSKNNLRTLALAADEIEAQAASKTKDERVEIDRTSKEYQQMNAIGVVYPEGKQYLGTGFLVDDCHVLTNAHVAFKEGVAGAKGARVHFSVGHSKVKGKQFEYADIGGTVIEHGDYTSHTLSDVNSDWTVIRLDQPIGKKVGSIAVYQMDPENLKNRDVITVGYPGDLTNNAKDLSKIFGDRKCKLLGMSVYGFEYHTCQTMPGQSGSPVMSKAKDGKFYALAMISGDNGFSLERKTEGSKANTAVSFDSGKKVGVVSDGDKIIATLQADKCE